MLGSYQIGVLKGLIENDILSMVNIVSGTSIGALNSCMVLGKMNYEEMLDVWDTINNENIYYEGLTRFKNDRLGLFDQKIMYNTLLKKQPKEKITKSDIKGYASVARISSNSVLSQIRREDMISEELYLNDSKDPHRVVLASSSVPIVFGPTRIYDRYYLDGGLLNNVPINVMVENKCDVIIVVGLNPNYDLSMYAKDHLVIDITTTKNLSLTILGMFDFNSSHMHKRIEYGYEQTIKMFEELKELGIFTKDGFKKDEKGLYRFTRFNKLEIIKEKEE